MSAPIRVAIRADAGRTLGTGHFARASAVATALSAGDDCEVILVTSEDGAPLVPTYFPDGVNVLTLASGAATPADALQALSARGLSPDVIYLDHYGEVRGWEAQALKDGTPLMVLDDLDEAIDADLIVRTHGGVPGGFASVILEGPAWLPLSQHVAALADCKPVKAAGRRLTLNVCFGGSDPTGETAKTLQALAALDALDADVLIGPGAQVDPALIEAAAALPHVILHQAPSPERTAELMNKADLAIGAGGVMLWERLCLDVPSLVVQVAGNQERQIDAVVAAGAIRFVGNHADVTSASMAEAIATLAADETARASLAAAGRRLIDGRGALRLGAWLKALTLSPRDVSPADAADLLRWRTHERNWQHNWTDARKPDLATHVAWLESRLADPDCVLRILARHDEPVGVARFDLGDAGRSAALSIYLVPAWHGRGMGLPVYFAAERALRLSHPGIREIVSRIHRDNAASIRLHRDAGFAISGSPEHTDWLDARKELT